MTLYLFNDQIYAEADYNALMASQCSSHVDAFLVHESEKELEFNLTRRKQQIEEAATYW